MNEQVNASKGPTALIAAIVVAVLLVGAASWFLVSSNQQIGDSAAGSAPSQAAAQAQATSSVCDMSGYAKASDALLNCRNWVTYSPRDFASVTTEQLTSDLTFLAAQGFRGLVTYDSSGGLQQAASIAKKVGFQKVAAGIWDPSKDVVAQAQAVAASADAIVVGNEGVSVGRYSYAQLEGWVNQVKSSLGASHPNLQVTTSEPWVLYLNQGNNWQYPGLMNLGDFVFPNLQPFFDNDPQWHSDPTNAANLVHNVWNEWFAPGVRQPHKDVILKETWWPSQLTDMGNRSVSQQTCFASQANQSTYFSALTAFPDVKFVYGEAQNVPKDPEKIGWCQTPSTGSAGWDAAPNWGLWNSLTSGQAKAAAGSVKYGHY